jgi:ferredoxin-NADP reductase
MAKLKVTLAGREKIADATYAFALDLGGQALPFRPGQTVDVTFPNPPYQDEAGNRRTFSLAEAPGKGRLLIATRDRGSAFKRSLIEAPLGTPLEIEGPYGSFMLPEKPVEAYLLAGGVGITPFRAMVQDTLERSLDHTLTLIHSNRKPEEAPFLLELLKWGTEDAKRTPDGRRPRFRYIPMMTQVEEAVESRPWERGRVSPELLADVLPAERNLPLYYVAGPQRFVHGAVDSLGSVGVDEGRIRYEEFPGY